MAKTTRGKGLLDKPARGRGTCPVCARTRIKLLYELPVAEGKTTKVCKNCRKLDPKKVKLA